MPSEPRDLSKVEICWLGRRPLPEVLDEQRRRREAIIEGTASEALWLLEHDPVITTGIRSVGGLDPQILEMPVIATERGGLATYHGPGQLVGYLLVDIGRRGGSVRKTVCAVEAGLIRWLKSQHMDAQRRPGMPGVWLGNEKIAAIGLHFRRGVTMHGFALNLTTDLSRFSGFIPCGIVDGGVTSVARVKGSAPEPCEAALGVGECVLEAVLSSTSRSQIDRVCD